MTVERPGPGGAVHVRPATEADVPRLAEIYRDAATVQGPEHYTPEQVAAWAAFADSPRFAAYVLEIPTLVAEGPGGVVGFGGLRDDGWLASLYVAPEAGRRGVGSRLLAALLERAAAARMPRVEAAASAFSRPLFERHGFVLDQVEEVVRHGTVFHRPRMVLRMGPDRMAAPG